MKLTFCGASRIVTGSCYHIDTGKDKVLVDCGMFQGPKKITRMNYDDFAFDPKEVTRLFLTHAHIDHSGLIPKLVDQGFYGEIICTTATKDLCKILLEDSAHMHETGTEHENRRRDREGLPPRKPLYTRREVADAMKLFRTVDYGEKHDITDGISVRYQDAGHILGSSIIELFIGNRKLVFSGDLGQWDNPIVKDPTLVEDADYLFIESTYGDRLHEESGDREQLLKQYIIQTHDKGGKLMIPSFAVERTQELLYAMHDMIEAKEFPNEKVFLDSPLAMRATEVFTKHRECYDEEASACKNPFKFQNLQYTHNARDSKKLNDYSMPCIIIAGSGMCTGGRIRHHLRHGLDNEKNTLLFVGYQAEGTLGRVILEGAKSVKMMGLEIDVNADVQKIDGFSAHSDYKGLLRWARGFKKKPKLTFVVHGEPDASESLKQKLETEGFTCKVPSILQKVELD
jgi:metallo-beta-lactamase family protein